jgi:iron complex transport system substrate-binding protein
MERLAHLAGTDAVGRRAAHQFRQHLQRLARTYQNRPKVRVFYQIWQTPLMTLNGKHMVSRVIDLCGGSNIFGNLPQLAPTVGIESVVEANPEAIIGYRNGNENLQAGWKRFPKMTAVARNNLYSVDPDLMTRAGPRIIDGAEDVCRQLEAARGKRR